MAETVANERVQETAFAGPVEVAADPSEPPIQSKPSTTRDLAPDLLRGLLMVLQAIDHCALLAGAWKHGVALEMEADGTPVHQWNATVPYIARSLTHLCAPGFTFLLGMGIVYFGRSRSKLGWSPWWMARHFAIRAFALAAINQIFLTLPIGGLRFWIFNFVLLALAVDYLLAGLIWLALTAVESTIATLLLALGSKNPERVPLLANSSTSNTASTAARVAWHAHNLLLIIFTAATAWMNIALSPRDGHCDMELETRQLGNTSGHGTFFDFWFYPTITEHIMSVFPPLAWLSFAILGLLWGRITTARPWKPYTLSILNASASATLFLLFILTRIFHFGNLSEDCLRMPEQLAHPDGDQYLASFRSFLYVVKYPPSVSFFALTMAVNFLLLAFFGMLPRNVGLRLKPLIVFGTSALFFYLVHLFVYFLMGQGAKKLFGHPLDGEDPLNGGPQVGVGNGLVVWVIWLLGLIILYPLCVAYGRFKSTKGADSVWRFF